MADQPRQSSLFSSLLRFSKELSKLLDEEFEMLSSRDLEGVEEFQDRKLRLMQSILEAREQLNDLEPSSQAISSFENLESILAACKDKHLRNDLLLKKQIEITKGLLNAITQRSQDQSSVYDKLGRLK